MIFWEIILIHSMVYRKSYLKMEFKKKWCGSWHSWGTQFLVLFLPLIIGVTSGSYSICSQSISSDSSLYVSRTLPGAFIDIGDCGGHITNVYRTMRSGNCSQCVPTRSKANVKSQTESPAALRPRTAEPCSTWYSSVSLNFSSPDLYDDYSVPWWDGAGEG